MKFRAKLVDIGCIQQFTKVLSTVSKISKTCTLRLSQDQVVLTQNEKAVNGGTSFWCEMNQVDYFDEYRIEGKDEKNEIYLEINNENVLRAMRSGHTAQFIKIKLTKKQTPCLTFEITLSSLTAHTRNVIHDVPVAVIPTRYWDDFKKPTLPNYNIKIHTPNLKIMKSVVERMKNISGFMVITALQNGELCFKVETDEVTASTYFQNMLVEPNEKSTLVEHDIDDTESVGARVDIQKLLSFLHAQLLNATKTICAIVDQKAVHMFVDCNDLLFQYFIPSTNIPIT
uniref:Checkpoint protein n=1 Tax=Hydra vulgaris TaxID=6087 RepID=T2MIV2_HYDVU